jgi:hypothetical protein
MWSLVSEKRSCCFGGLGEMGATMKTYGVELD